MKERKLTKKEQDFIKNFSENRDIISQFLVKDKQIKKSKNNKPYLELTLQDKTGEIKGRMFTNHSYREHEKIETNKIWNIVGKVQEFPVQSGRYNILIDEIHPSKKFDEKDFIRTVKNYSAHITYLFKTISEIKNPYLKEILDSFFKNSELKNKFLSAPAAKIHHHNYKGGLLVHTNEVVEICKTIAKLYNDIDGDLLITGAILHDIGKIETYSYETNDIDIKYEGRMLDHLFIGANMLETNMKKINAPKTLKIKLIHLILSHHGKTELGWGSTVDPKIPEAIALHQADDMSAKITSSLEKQ